MILRGAAAIVLVLAIAGCGDPAPTVDEYRDDLRARATAFADEGEQLRVDHLFQLERSVDDLVKQTDQSELEDAVIEETARRTAALFAALTDAVQRYATDLQRIVAPPSVREAHDELVAALELSITDIGTTMDALETAASFAEIDAAIGGSPFNDSAPRVDTACVRLEAALAEQGASADLHCRDR